MLRHGLYLVACAGGLCCSQTGLAGTPAYGLGASPLFVLAASDSNSSIAVSKSKNPAQPKHVKEEQPVPPLPDKKDAKSVTEKGATPPPPAWKPEEITAAQARCATILKDIDAVSVPQPPIREGQCGTPAPIRLISVGKNPQVTFSPPALVDCELAGALHGWIKNDVQPLAMKHLRAKIIRVEVMSDYSCRNSAGRGGTHLSEHAFANALDIGGFVTEKGETASVLNGWGTPKREIAERIAAEQAKAEQQAAPPAADAKGQQDPKVAKPADQANTGAAETKADAKKPAAPVATASSTPAASGTKRERSDKLTVALRGAAKSPSEEITKLGGPKTFSARKADSGKSVAALQIEEQPPTPQAKFLHEAHAAACRIFGTTLGPEANADHRNHFHVDMAERTYKKICD